MNEIEQIEIRNMPPGKIYVCDYIMQPKEEADKLLEEARKQAKGDDTIIIVRESEESIQRDKELRAEHPELFERDNG